MESRASHLLRTLAAAVLTLCAAQAGRAQLNENCTVSVLNRTVRVNPDGSWVLPNVPANFGQVKARATCVENGVTRSGESEFFTISANGSINLPLIVLGAASKVPSSLTVAPATVSLTAAGQTVQLVVTAHYPDNSTKDVSAGAAGTNYTTSNAAIATVGPDGLVTAVASGTVVIQATNDGASAIITANVTVVGTDSDADGIPDADEVRLGLDPQNPVDAQEDFDRDDLTNLREFQLGTDLRKRDTDEDGLSDGEEVNRLLTNPLLPDTDGDGVPDGVESQTGSNPLDPSSFNLARALRSIEVTPRQFALIVNTLVGEASQQLTVTGRLIDGKTTINLTSRGRGTNYSSSNLSIANFGATDGLVFAGGDGVATITATNNGFTATANVTVSSFAPTALSFIAIPGFANNVDVSGDFAYVAAGSAGLQVIDVSDRRAPRIVGSLDTPGNANDVKVVGRRAYVADGSAGLRIIDVSNTAAPSLLGTLDTSGDARDIVVVGDRAYVADGSAGLKIIDVSNPQSPALLGALDTPGSANGVDVVGNIAVVADGNSLRTIDVTNPASPAALGSVSTTSSKDLTVEGNTAYVADYTGSLRVIDISTPAAPRLLASTTQSLGGILTDVAKSREFVFGADELFPNGVSITNVANPAAPVVRARLDFPSRDDNGTGIAVDNSYVYLTADRSSTENGSNGDSRLYIGQYFAVEDRAGVPPVVSITSPAAGGTVVEGSTLPITVQATDDVQVVSVDFIVDGTIVFTDSAAPYQFNLAVPTGATSLTLGATAIDPGSNVGVAANVVVNVIPDPLTTVTGRVLEESSTPVAGASVSVLGRTAQTGADGTFSIPNVPTAQGSLIVSATLTRPDGVVLVGASVPTQPVAGGTSDVGNIVILAAAFEPNIGTLVERCDDCSVSRTLPFNFTFYGRTYSQVLVSTNGHLTFNSLDDDYSETVPEFLSGPPRISALWDDLESADVDGASGLYVNDQLPGRFVMTWWRGLEYSQVPGLNTLQVIIFSDGRIQLSYQGVASLDGIVGLSPGGLTPSGPPARAIDFSSATPSSTGAGEAVYEQFEVLNPRGDTDDQGASNTPFDLDRNSILFRPNAGGGYDIRTVRLPTSASSRPEQTIAPDRNRRPTTRIKPVVPRGAGNERPRRD
ncbi:MAG: Ig-like domain-containing protein [Pyrinomonadaceae bacterium]